MTPQKLIGEPPGRIAPVNELINAYEFESMAERKLDSVTFAGIAGGDRSAFERITFRPRLMIDSTRLDLSIDLFGQTLFAPILIGPASQQKRFHPEGELAMARGASAAKAVMIVADGSSYPIEQIAAESKTTLWYQVYLDTDARARAQRAIAVGCKALCITLGAPGKIAQGPVIAGVDWSAIDRLRQGLQVPVLLKGIMSPEEARKAAGMGVHGIVVSNYTPSPVIGVMSSIEVLPSIVDAVAGKMPVLIDGSFRRGSDVMKAIAMGAQAVLLGRPPLWGLAAYGSDGVQKIVELIQTEFARVMAGCGKVDIKSVDRTVIKIHRR